MRKSGKVILSVVLLSAVANTRLQAQSVHSTDTAPQSDSTYKKSGGGRFYHTPFSQSRFMRFVLSRGPASYRTPATEKAGFGSTANSMFVATASS